MKVRLIPCGLPLLLSLVSIAISCTRPKRDYAGEREELYAVVRLETGNLPRKDVFLRDALRSEFPAVRARAVRALRRVGALDDFAELETLLEDEEPAVRLEAVCALGRAAEPSAPFLQPFLLGVATDPDPWVRAASVKALSRIRGVASDWLEEACRDPAPVVRREALFALAALKDPMAYLSLRRIASVERDERVRWAVYWALAASGDVYPEVTDDLIGAVGDPNFLVAVYALRGLASAAGVDGVEEILATLRDPGKFWLVREAAVHTLSEYLERENLSPQMRMEIEGAFLELLLHRDSVDLYSPVRECLSASLSRGGGGVSGGTETTNTRGTAAATKSSPVSASRQLGELVDASPALFLNRTGRNPRVRVTVEGRGEILIELFALDAPRHVARFIERVERGYYDGGKVMAIDPATGVSFADTSVPSPEVAARVLPGETFYRPYLRGALLAVPLTRFTVRRPTVRAEDPLASAGGSFLIALVPQPELEGLVTCFGKVALGMEVLDRFEAGDVIESIRRVE